MEWKLKKRGEVNFKVANCYQLKFGSNGARHMACRWGWYMIWSLRTSYFILLYSVRIEPCQFVEWIVLHRIITNNYNVKYISPENRHVGTLKHKC